VADDRGAPPSAESAADRRPSNLIRFAPAKGVEHLSTWKSTDPFSITVEEDA